MTRKVRRLSPEDQRLWQKITDTATPLGHKPSFFETSKSKPKEQPGATPSSVPAFRIGQSLKETKSETRLRIPDQPLRMDRRTFDKMKRGKTNPEARIDLHGMTVDVAHSALRAFLLRAHGEGKRLVLVITGKGRDRRDADFLSEPSGVLRRQVPLWLDMPPLWQIVLQTAPAHQKHGGAGALYVYLRR